MAWEASPPLKSTKFTGVHEAKAFHPLAELMELRRQWRVPLAGTFHGDGGAVDWGWWLLSH